VKTRTSPKRRAVVLRREAPLTTPTDLKPAATRDITLALNAILADVYALYFKTKNFHWHLSGPHFRDYHKLFDEQAEQLLGMTDAVAERVRKIGGMTLHSIGESSRLQRIVDNDADFVAPADMLTELTQDNKMLAVALRATHQLCDKHKDVATASMIEIWIDEGERRTWFLFESGREERAGH